MFKFSDGISLKAWGDVDKTALRNGLVKALQNKEPDAQKAIRKVYAVIRESDITKTPSTSWWGPYYEVRSDGTIILNKGGLYAVAAALAGARTKPNLTPRQLKVAARKVVADYRKQKLPVPNSLVQITGEINEALAVRFDGAVIGEMGVDTVPLSEKVDIDKLKAGDDDPLEVVVEIDSGKSKRKWNYLPQALESISRQINEKVPNGFLGHQKQENLAFEFPKIATHWVGAMYRDGKAYVRGVVDASQKDLKRWIRGGRIKQVSIYGIPTLRKENGETQVVDFDLMSLDWTPKDRNGMQTKVVTVSEMDDLLNKQNTDGGVKVTKQEVLGEMARMLKEGEISLTEAKTLVGETDETLKFKDVAKQLDVAPENVVGEISRLKNLEKQVAESKHENLVKKVLNEEVKDETIRGIVGEMIDSDVEDDEKKIASEIADILQRDTVKKIVSGLHLDDKPEQGADSKNAKKYTRVVKARI